MDEKHSIDYSQISTPFVIHSNCLQLWPCFDWTLKDWCEKCGQTLCFPFRVHKKIANTFWENEAIDRFEAQLKHYMLWTQSDSTDCLNEDNPFKKYPKTDHWVYSSYNYMDRLFSQPNHQEIIQSVRWSELGLDSTVRLESTAKNSTLWIGSESAFTPCHQDSYGYNFVAQLSGKKLWILFPPSDANGLYPTRIPYEESSVFSSVDFQNPDYELHPLFKHTSPHIIELNAGEILFIPHLWWHYVRVINEDFEKSCISINTWIFNDCFQSSLNESIARFLTTSLFNTYCPSDPTKWLNTNADLFTAEEAVHSIVLMLEQCKAKQPKESVEPKQTETTFLPKNSSSVESSTFEELGKYLNKNFKNKKFKSSEQRKESTKSSVSTESIVNCVLHPDVIELIAQKLKQISVNT